jgi:signal transduction histidine kinase
MPHTLSRLVLGVIILFLVLITSTVLVAVYRPAWLLGLNVATLALFGLGAAITLGELAREEEQRQILLKVSEGLAARTELDDLLDFIVQAILKSVPRADKCVIHLLDQTGRRLYPRYSSQPEWAHSAGMPADKGVAGKALQELRPQVVPDVRRATGFLPLKSSPELRALMVVPLHAQGRPLGTISLNSNIPRAFSRRDEMLVTMLATQASAAIYQKQLYASALRENRHIEAIINNLSDGLIVLDAEGCVLRYNPALAHLIGVDEESIVGQKVDPESELPELRRLALALGDCLSDVRQARECQVELNEPVRALLRVCTSPVVDHEGNWGQIILLHDQTEELDLIRAQASFIAAAAREIQLPLDAIRGYATLLLSALPRDPQHWASWAGEIRRQSARLKRLIQDLADLGAGDGRRPIIRLEPVSPAELIREAFAEVSEMATRKKVTLELQGQEDLANVALDHERINHALLYLLENALHRASPGGKVTVKIEASLEELALTLTDDGQPIPPEARERIFQGSYRTDGALPGDPAGTGLGLYLSRKIVEAHGGHLWLAEESERGNKLHCLLPLLPPENAQSRG